MRSPLVEVLYREVSMLYQNRTPYDLNAKARPTLLIGNDCFPPIN
jgi:hypothetical protein